MHHIMLKAGKKTQRLQDVEALSASQEFQVGPGGMELDMPSEATLDLWEKWIFAASKELLDQFLRETESRGAGGQVAAFTLLAGRFNIAKELHSTIKDVGEYANSTGSTISDLISEIMQTLITLESEVRRPPNTAAEMTQVVT
jgi:hypothetical protein